METYLNANGVECVKWQDEQGSHSMLKSAYDEMQAQQVEHLTEIPTPDEA